MSDKIEELYQKNRLIVRAMDWPSLIRIDGSNFAYDFSTWAEEIFLSQQTEGLTSISSTLLVPNVNIPTYKAIGFMINGNTAQIEHISEIDSGSYGNKSNGDFFAFGKSLKDLDELVSNIKTKRTSGVMNEVNISISTDDIVGIFYNKSGNVRNKLYALLAQYIISKQIKRELPIYEYDHQNGTITQIQQDITQQQQFLKDMFDSKILKTPLLHFTLENDQTLTINTTEKIKHSESVM